MAENSARRGILTARALGQEPNWDKISTETGVPIDALYRMDSATHALPAPLDPASYEEAIPDDLMQHPWARVRQAHAHTLSLVQRWEDRNDTARTLQGLLDQRGKIDDHISALTAELVDMGVLEGDDPE
jgi:hypothetical protein